MNISDRLTQQQLKEIALRIYSKGQASPQLDAKDLIGDIKEQIMSAIQSQSTNQGLYAHEKRV